jgi:elongation factor G|tara:strand:- start:47 stop:337 length:291 start_codon:yes stop_codon:yes gene_type:complete
MAVEVTVPAEYSGSIMGQLMKRRGSITGTETRAGLFIMTADVPLASMFGYATELRGSTQGIGEFAMEYRKHLPVADFEVQHVIDAYAQKVKDNRID